MVGAIVGAHVVAAWGLLQVREVREAVAQAAPIFVSLVAPEKPPEPVAPPPPPAAPKPVTRRETPKPIIAAAPTPAPSPPVFVAPLPPIEEPTPVVVAPPAPPAPPAPAPAPPAPAPQPKIIPASAVQYLVAPAPQYPRLSMRLGETGRVLVRVFIDRQGLATNVQVSRSSGHPRLDEAALAAVRKARFKPYTENGQPVEGWAFIPLDFELEK